MGKVHRRIQAICDDFMVGKFGAVVKRKRFYSVTSVLKLQHPIKFSVGCGFVLLVFFENLHIFCIFRLTKCLKVCTIRSYVSFGHGHCLYVSMQHALYRASIG